jgi:hypothetical protein
METPKNICCSHCESDKIETSIAIGKSAEVGNVGPKYKANWLMMGVSQMYCDLCLDCGELIRFYIKDKTDRQWDKTPGSLGSK